MSRSPRSLGAAGGYYAFNEPLKQYTQGSKVDPTTTTPNSGSDPRRPGTGKETQSHPGGGSGSGGSADGRGDALSKDGPTSSSPHPSLHSGGASPVDPGAKTVAGTSAQGRKGNSADPDVKIRSAEDARKHDGSGGGGVGVKEMKERKAAGQGLPSAQVRFQFSLSSSRVSLTLRDRLGRKREEPGKGRTTSVFRTPVVHPVDVGLGNEYAERRGHIIGAKERKQSKASTDCITTIMRMNAMR